MTASTPLVFYSRSKDTQARALSNFADSPFDIDGAKWATVEHYYQGNKFPSHLRAPFHASQVEGRAWHETALDAKKAGGKAAFKRAHLVLTLSKADLTAIMLRALRAKFAIPAMRELLVATGDRPLHHFERQPGLWGCHTDKETGEIKKGHNLLGRMLMQIRSQL